MGESFAPGPQQALCRSSQSPESQSPESRVRPAHVRRSTAPPTRSAAGFAGGPAGPRPPSAVVTRSGWRAASSLSGHVDVEGGAGSQRQGATGPRGGPFNAAADDVGLSSARARGPAAQDLELDGAYADEGEAGS